MQIGDWIITKYQKNSNGEHIRGWVTSVSAGYIGMNPINLEGTTSKTYKDWEIKPMDDFQPDDKDIRAMLEIAISTWDKGWFEELNKQVVKHP